MPQGSPCSPIISNLITRVLDAKLLHFARKNKLIYTRYVDDITFSTNRKEGVESVLFMEDDHYKISPKLQTIIKDAGFKCNEAKTKFYNRSQCQIVTGLTVNDCVRVPRSYYLECRAMCDHLFKNCEYYIKTFNGEEIIRQPEKSIQKLMGKVNYLYHIYNKQETKKAKNQEYHSIEKLRKQLYWYNNIIASDHKAVIFVEGKTDYLYLKSALKYFYNKCKSDSKARWIYQLIQERYDKVTGEKRATSYIKIINQKNIQIMLGASGVNKMIQFINKIDKDEGLKFINNHFKTLNKPIIFITDTDKNSLFKKIDNKNENKECDEIEIVGKLKDKFEAEEKGIYKLKKLPVYVLPIINEYNKEIENILSLETIIRGSHDNRMKDGKLDDNYKAYVANYIVKKVFTQNSKALDDFDDILERISKCL